jgi:hypothetical protein
VVVIGLVTLRPMLTWQLGRTCWSLSAVFHILCSQLHDLRTSDPRWHLVRDNTCQRFLLLSDFGRSASTELAADIS